MRPQAHVASGLLVWSASPQRAWELPADLVAANLPDFDRSVAKRLGVEGRAHHTWVTHSFLGWAPPTALALALARRMRDPGPVHRAVALVWVHLLLDTYHHGIAWLWPLSKERVGLFRGPPGIRDDGWNTPAPLSTEAGKVEAAFWALSGLAVLLRRR